MATADRPFEEGKAVDEAPATPPVVPKVGFEQPRTQGDPEQIMDAVANRLVEIVDAPEHDVQKEFSDVAEAAYRRYDRHASERDAAIQVEATQIAENAFGQQQPVAQQVRDTSDSACWNLEKDKDFTRSDGKIDWVGQHAGNRFVNHVKGVTGVDLARAFDFYAISRTVGYLFAKVMKEGEDDRIAAWINRGFKNTVEPQFSKGEDGNEPGVLRRVIPDRILEKYIDKDRIKFDEKTGEPRNSGPSLKRSMFEVAEAVTYLATTAAFALKEYNQMRHDLAPAVAAELGKHPDDVSFIDYAKSNLPTVKEARNMISAKAGLRGVGDMSFVVAGIDAAVIMRYGIILLERTVFDGSQKNAYNQISDLVDDVSKNRYAGKEAEDMAVVKLIEMHQANRTDFARDPMTREEVDEMLPVYRDIAKGIIEGCVTKSDIAYLLAEREITQENVDFIKTEGLEGVARLNGYHSKHKGQDVEASEVHPAVLDKAYEGHHGQGTDRAVAQSGK